MSKKIKEDKIRIIISLDRAKCAAPLGYISKHSRIENPLELLQELEKDGLVDRLPSGIWNPSLMPLFELTDKAKELLKHSIEHQFEQLAEIII